MANYSVLKAAIADVIKTNGNNEITGTVLQNTLLSIINNSVAVGALYVGMATPTTNPGTPDANIFYLASQTGTYVNFGGYVMTDTLVLFSTNSSGEWIATTLISNKITTLDTYGLTKYIKELYIVGIIDIDFVQSRSFSISPTTGRLIVYINNNAVLDFNITSGMESNKVYEPTTVHNSAYYGYMMFNPIGTASFTDTSTFFLTFDNKKIMSLSYAPFTANYIRTKQQTQIETNATNITGNTNSIIQLRNDVLKSNVVISGTASLLAINNYVAELFIGNGNPDSTFVIMSFSLDLTNMQFRIFIYENASNVLTTTQTPINAKFWGRPYKLKFIDDSDKYGWVVFKEVRSGYNISGTAILDKSKILDLSFNPVILEYITETNATNINNLMGIIPHVNFTSDSNVNLRIKELYVPGLQSDWRLSRLYCRVNEIRFFIKANTSSTTNNIVQLGYDNIGVEEYGNIITLYNNNTPEIMGYCILEYYDNEDFTLDSIIIMNDNVKTLDKSPNIKKMLEANEQIMLMSASSFGFNNPANVLKDFLIRDSGKRIYNCGFGGCRMSWRTADGSSNYDAFSAVDIAKAIVSGDFSKQIASNTALGGEYKNRLADLMQIDFSKPTTILCKYIDNDITGNVPIGNLWKYTDLITDFDKTTFLGAMNYVFSIIMSVFPHIRWVFLSELWRYKTDKYGNSVPPYAFVNAIDVAGLAYSDAQRENALRLGASWFDFVLYGVQNNYNRPAVMFDESHYNYFGWQMLSKKLAALVKSEMN